MIALYTQGQFTTSQKYNVKLHLLVSLHRQQTAHDDCYESLGDSLCHTPSRKQTTTTELTRQSQTTTTELTRQSMHIIETIYI